MDNYIKESNKDIYGLAKELMEEKDISSWQSDLYLRKNAISDKLVKVYQKLAQTQDARIRCKEQNNMEWFDKHEDTITDIIKNYMPHGSGIDGNTTFNFEKSNGERLVIDSEYHAMNENGYYTEWIDYTVTVKPSLIHDISLSIVGNFGKHQDIKDYLYDVYREALTQTIK